MDTLEDNHIHAQSEDDQPETQQEALEEALLDTLNSALEGDTESSIFLAPSIDSQKINSGASYTYHSDVPEELINSPEQPVILGVDEAGRGPVLGPMVYAVAYCHESFSPTLTEDGFADSKKLTASHRGNLIRKLCSEKDAPLYKSLGWSVRVMSPQDISSGMLRAAGTGSYNLNAQAHDTTINLIQEVLKKGVNVKKIFVDTVGPPTTYQAKLQKLFPGTSVTVTKKADSLFPIVSAASVCAKVTRDEAIYICSHSLSSCGYEKPLSSKSKTTEDTKIEILGSGYPGDAKTISWLKETIDPVFGWRGAIVRFSWQTVRDLLEKDGRAKVIWAEEPEDGLQSITTFFGKKGSGDEAIRGWYGVGVSVT